MKCLLSIIFILFNFSVAAYAVLKDPTRPIESDRNPQVPLMVSAIIISGNSRAAVINGAIVKEGDVVGGMRIIKIESNEVDVEQDNIKTPLYLVNKVVKQKLLDSFYMR